MSTAAELYEWCCRVRRDILALQLVALQTHPNNWTELLGEWPLKADQNGVDANTDAEEILKEMGESADPGAPPPPPYN